MYGLVDGDLAFRTASVAGGLKLDRLPEEFADVGKFGRGSQLSGTSLLRALTLTLKTPSHWSRSWWYFHRYIHSSVSISSESKSNGVKLSHCHLDIPLQ